MLFFVIILKYFESPLWFHKELVLLTLIWVNRFAEVQEVFELPDKVGQNLKMVRPPLDPFAFLGRFLHHVGL